MSSSNHAGDAPISLPYEPHSVFHKHGGRITRIDRIEHETARPVDGRSQDTWHYVGAVEWDDGSASDAAQIAPWALCVEDLDVAGRRELGAILNLMNVYLDVHGVYRDGEGGIRGWYAHARPPEHCPRRRRSAGSRAARP